MLVMLSMIRQSPKIIFQFAAPCSCDWEEEATAMPKIGHAQSVLMPDSFIRDSPQCHRTSCHEPGHSLLVITGQLSMQHNGCVSWIIADNWNTVCSSWCNTSCHCNQSHNKSMTDTTILHVETSFSSAERGSCQEILSQTSLTLHLVLIHSKFTIFICEQLKGHATFSAVHDIAHWQLDTRQK